jgi:hypothetical protein
MTSLKCATQRHEESINPDDVPKQTPLFGLYRRKHYFLRQYGDCGGFVANRDGAF